MSDPACRVGAVREVRDILGRLAVVDVETTGLDPACAHVIEVGALFVAPDAAPTRRSWLVRPPGPVPAWITALTGLDEGELSGAPRFGEVEGELKAALAGWTLVAHNAAFERGFLGEVVGGAAMLDSCVLTHLLFPELPSHALDALVRWAGVGSGAQHRALGDAEDTLRVLEVALARVIAEGRRADVEVLLQRLTPAEGADAAALVELLERLRDATPSVGQPPPRVQSCADERLARLLERELSGGPGCLEIERPGATAAALEVATRFARGREGALGEETDDRESVLRSAAPPLPRALEEAGVPLVLAVPRRTLRELAPSSPLPLVQRSPTCRARLAQVLSSTQGVGDGARLGRAYLSALLRRSPLLVPSRWFIGQAPEVPALLRAAGPCRCGDRACAGALPEGAGHAVLVSHELALDWLEQRVPMALVALDADRLPAAERRRTSLRLDAQRLAKLAGRLWDRSGGDGLAARLTQGADLFQHALEALAGQVGLTVDLRARALGPWLRLRDVLTGLRKDVTAWLAAAAPGDSNSPALAQLADELARLAEPPPPGFDARVHGGDAPILSLEPRHPEAAIAARLPRWAVLVTGSPGTLEWAQRPTHHVGPLARPSVELEPCVASAHAVATHAARLALQLAGPVNLVVEGRLEDLAETIREDFPRLPVRTVPGAPPPGGACVRLVPWPGPTPPDALATLVGPVRDVRRAVLACGEQDVTVLVPAERWDEVASRLEELRDDGGGLRLGLSAGLDVDAR